MKRIMRILGGIRAISTPWLLSVLCIAIGTFHRVHAQVTVDLYLPQYDMVNLQDFFDLTTGDLKGEISGFLIVVSSQQPTRVELEFTITADIPRVPNRGGFPFLFRVTLDSVTAPITLAAGDIKPGGRVRRTKTEKNDTWINDLTKEVQASGGVLPPGSLAAKVVGRIAGQAPVEDTETRQVLYSTLADAQINLLMENGVRFLSTPTFTFSLLKPNEFDVLIHRSTQVGQSFQEATAKPDNLVFRKTLPTGVTSITLTPSEATLLQPQYPYWVHAEATILTTSGTVVVKSEGRFFYIGPDQVGTILKNQLPLQFSDWENISWSYVPIGGPLKLYIDGVLLKTLTDVELQQFLNSLQNKNEVTITRGQ